ncbi:hypothetical protein ABZZ36_35055 [Actinacidiphila glaucinigra]|uniref:hypothetical protein n=1 Tax=Actinacidiphila glaucinigra TaxID=235986 RepID=UPI0033B34B56
MTGRMPPSGTVVEGVDFHRWVVALCKPDAVDRGLVDQVLERISGAYATVVARLDLTAQAWQAHVHYWDLLVNADWFTDRDIPACLDAEYAGRPVTVALIHGAPGVHARLREAQSPPTPGFLLSASRGLLSVEAVEQLVRALEIPGVSVVELNSEGV